MLTLCEYLAAVTARAASFNWADRNCCHFATGWVKEATGRDPMAGLPHTSSAREARHLVQQLGGDLRAAFGARHAGAEIAPAFAQTGDVALVMTTEGNDSGVGEMLGICTGRQVALLDAAGAVAFLPLAGAVAAWRLQP